MNQFSYEFSCVVPLILVCEVRVQFSVWNENWNDLKYFFFRKIFQHLRLSRLMLYWRVSCVRLGERMVCISDFSRSCTVTLSRLQYVCRRKERVHKMKEGRREIGEVSVAAGMFERVWWLDYRTNGIRCWLFSRAFTSVLWPAQPATHFVPTGILLGAKRPKRQADHSPHSLIEVRNTWSCVTASLYVFMAVLSYPYGPFYCYPNYMNYEHFDI